MTAAVGMAETEVLPPPPAPAMDEPVAKDAAEKRDGKPERRREREEIPEMTVEEAQKALNALPKASRA